MSEKLFAEIEKLGASPTPAAALDKLVETLEQQREYHKLFDALLLRKRLQMGLPLLRPSSFDDIPKERQEEFEEAYVATARRVGDAFLADNNIPQAWLYFRTIREPEKVAAAIEAIPVRSTSDPEIEEVMQIALYEGANPVKGIELMLNTHGTCNTITALDQAMQQLKPAERSRAAALLVRTLYRDLSQSVQREVSQRTPFAPPAGSLRELILGRDWLFEEGNYHIDVSHLHSTVRFARSLEVEHPDLDLVIQLCEYGSRLTSQFQYPGEPPFDDYYPAHLQFFRVLANNKRDEGLQYFRERLEAEPDEEDKPILAFVLVDLLIRSGKQGEAVEIAEKYLSDHDDPQGGFSFTMLCRQAGRLDILQRVARERNDLVGYAAAVLEKRS